MHLPNWLKSKERLEEEAEDARFQQRADERKRKRDERSDHIYEENTTLREQLRAAQMRARMFEVRYRAAVHDVKLAHAHIQNQRADFLRAAGLSGEWHNPEYYAKPSDPDKRNEPGDNKE